MLKTEKINQLQVFLKKTIQLERNYECLGDASDLIEKYEEIHDPLFINSEWQGDLERDWSIDDDLELKRAILHI